MCIASVTATVASVGRRWLVLDCFILLGKAQPKEYAFAIGDYNITYSIMAQVLYVVKLKKLNEPNKHF